MSRVSHILEFVSASGGPGFRVDREAGRIFGCKILGEHSDNNRHYTPECRRTAATLYEGRGSFIDHADKPGESRSVKDKIGWFSEVELGADGCPYGTFNVVKAHPMANYVFEIAERAPNQLGFSHDAFGKTRRGKDGGEVVEALERVNSIDLVTDPASVKGLHESLSRSRTMSKPVAGKKTRRQALAEHIHAPKLRKWLLEFDDGAGMAMDEPAEDPIGDAGAMPDDQPEHGKELFDALCAMVNNALDGADEAVFSKNYLGKLKKIKAICEDGSGGGDAPDEPEAPADVMPATESRKLKTEHAQALRENRVYALCAASSFTPSAVQVKALVPLDDTEAKTLIESFQKGAAQQQPNQKPRSRGRDNDSGPAPGANGKGDDKPLQESLKFEGDKGAEERLRFLRS